MSIGISPLARVLRCAIPLAVLALSGCAVVTVADAAISTGATVVSAGASVVGAAVEAAAAGVKAVVRSDDKKN